MNCHDLLVDGSLGEAGLYDGNKTIAVACQASKPPKPALMLYLLARAFNPRNVIELGTNLGISSAYLAAAMQVNGPNGRLVTLEASPYRQRTAKEVHANLGLDNVTYVQGLFTDTLPNTLKRIGPVDMAFIDGHHQYEPTLAYLEQILPFATPDAVFVFDDIRWSDGMKKAWADIQKDERFGLIVDLYSVGICLRAPAEEMSRSVLPPIYHAI